jgi:hypothetical protein
MTSLCLVNNSKLITNADVAAIVTPLNKWIATYVGPSWGVSGAVTQTVSPSSWLISLQDTIDQANDLGYHVDNNGRVTAIIDIAACRQYQTAWTTCVAHEIAEMLVDPTASRTAPMGNADYMLEVCDPVEGQGAEVEGVSMCNFVLPSYFENGPPPYDWLQVLNSPCPHIVPGGYQMYYSDGQWQQVSGFKAMGYMAQRTTGRRAYRKAHTATYTVDDQVSKPDA